MKSILMSIRPEWVAKILNKEKTLEIRRRFPKDYVGWVHIYCTKGKPNIAKSNETKTGLLDLNGKVIARFWCDKVEEIVYDYGGLYEMFQTSKLDCDNLNAKSCLSDSELKNYLKPRIEHGDICGYAIHITKLEIFDKPKEISEFKYYKKFSEIDYMLPIPRKETCERLAALTRAPESYCYVEV